MAKKATQTVASLIDDINKRLDSIEESSCWLVRASARFKVGHRVEFSPIADRRGISGRRKGSVRTGKVTKVRDGPFIDVLLDGYAKPKGFHHMFFNVTTKRRKR